MDTSLIARELGKIGGEKTKSKYGIEHFKRMRVLSGLAKKRKKSKKSTFKSGVAVTNRETVMNNRQSITQR